MSLQREKLEKKLDKVCGDYIKKRDGYKCVTCGKTKETIVIDWGHLITRTNRATRWNEINTHAQCRLCNSTHEYHPEIFTNWFLKKYGQKQYERLVLMSSKPAKYSLSDLEYMIKYFQNKLRELNEASLDR